MGWKVDKRLLMWRELVGKRDRWTCAICGRKRGEITICVHHVWPAYRYPELRYRKGNGICMCRGCHEAFHRQFGASKATPRHLERFAIEQGASTAFLLRIPLPAKRRRKPCKKPQKPKLTPEQRWLLAEQKRNDREAKKRWDI